MILSESFIRNNSTFTSDASDIDLLFEQYENDVSILNEFGVINESGGIRKIFDKLVALIKKVMMFLSDQFGRLFNAYKAFAQTILVKAKEHKLHIDRGFKRILQNKIIIYIKSFVPYAAEYSNPDYDPSSIFSSNHKEREIVTMYQFPSEIRGRNQFFGHIKIAFDKLLEMVKDGKDVETDPWKLLDVEKNVKYMLKDFPMYSTVWSYRSVTRYNKLDFDILNQSIKDAEQRSSLPITNRAIEFPVNELKLSDMEFTINELGRNINQASRQLRINQSALTSSVEQMSIVIEDYTKELNKIDRPGEFSVKDKVLSTMNQLGSIYSEYIKVYLNALKTQTTQYIKYCKESIDIRKRVLNLCITIGSVSEDNLQQSYYIDLGKSQENDDSNFKKNTSYDDDDSSSSGGAKKDDSSSKNDTKDTKTNRNGQRLLN